MKISAYPSVLRSTVLRPVTFLNSKVYRTKIPWSNGYAAEISPILGGLGVKNRLPPLRLEAFETLHPHLLAHGQMSTNLPQIVPCTPRDGILDLFMAWGPVMKGIQYTSRNLGWDGHRQPLAFGTWLRHDRAKGLDLDSVDIHSAPGPGLKPRPRCGNWFDWFSSPTKTPTRGFVPWYH